MQKKPVFNFEANFLNFFPLKHGLVSSDKIKYYSIRIERGT